MAALGAVEGIRIRAGSGVFFFDISFVSIRCVRGIFARRKANELAIAPGAFSR